MPQRVYVVFLSLVHAWVCISVVNSDFAFSQNVYVGNVIGTIVIRDLIVKVTGMELDSFKYIFSGSINNMNLLLGLNNIFDIVYP